MPTTISYRLLSDGEVMHLGDEIFSKDFKWRPVVAFAGQAVGSLSGLIVRRPLPSTAAFITALAPFAEVHMELSKNALKKASPHTPVWGYNRITLSFRDFERLTDLFESLPPCQPHFAIANSQSTEASHV